MKQAYAFFSYKPFYVIVQYIVLIYGGGMTDIEWSCTISIDASGIVDAHFQVQRGKFIQKMRYHNQFLMTMKKIRFSCKRWINFVFQNAAPGG